MPCSSESPVPHAGERVHLGRFSKADIDCKRLERQLVRFSLLIKLDERTRNITTTNFGSSGWVRLFEDARMTTALLDRLTHQCHVLETANNSFGFKASPAHDRKSTRENIRNLTSTPDPKHK